MGEGRLFLSRLLGQRIVIAGNITITIVGIRNDRVSLEIRAPKGIIVDREEVHLRRKLKSRSDESSPD
jgi:carbon storage regulator